MAKIIPFQGLRYSDPQNRVLDRLVTPPYDIISSAEQERFYRRHKHNIIRLELGKIRPSDHESDNRYTRAARTLEDWLRQGVLKKEARPSYYLVQTEYRDPMGREKTFTGLFCRVKLEALGEGKILPHEKTYEGPKTDRFNLLKETGVSFSPVLALYRDSSEKIAAFLQRVTGRKPAFDFEDWAGCRQRLWLISQPDEQRVLEACFKGKKLLIADGHHRYSTALRYQREFGQAAGEAADYVMMCLSETHDEGLTVLPVYRLVQNVSAKQWQHFKKNVSRNFELERVTDCQRLCEVQARVQAATKHPAIGFIGDKGKQAYLLKWNGKDYENPADDLGIRHSRIYCRLDVVVLNHLILDDLLGIKPGEENGRVAYTKNFNEAYASVTQGRLQAAFLPGLPNLDAIWDLAKNGETMPQKSTYFLPKIITGLVLNPVKNLG